MKKILYVSLVLVVALIVWLYLKPTDALVESPPPQPETNLIEVASNTAHVEGVSQPANVIGSTVPLTNALIATNIQQWKALIKGLHKSPGLSESWHMEETNQASYVPITFQENGQTISYKIRFIDISIKNENGDILEAEARSPMMNIDETRELGLQLCNMLQVDPRNFLAWCDKVGNNWLDQPLFGDGNRYYSFHLFHTYDNEKPWSISFMITPNP
jgi:hypothetical protein